MELAVAKHFFIHMKFIAFPFNMNNFHSKIGYVHYHQSYCIYKNTMNDPYDSEQIFILRGVAMPNQYHAYLSSSVTSEILLKTCVSWDGVAYTSYPQGAPELSILKITIPPQTLLPWHTHPMPNAVYVLSGHLIVEKRSDSSRTVIYAGDTLAEVARTVHRGFTESEAVTLIAFYAGAEGLPIREIIE